MSLGMSSEPAYEENNDDLLCLLTDAWENPLKETIKDARWIHDYLTRLTSLSLTQLLHEPLELRQEQADAIRDAQQLACQQYPSFLSAQTCRDTVENTVDGLDSQLDQFIQSVPELEEACRTFESHANTIRHERNKITRVLEHQQVLTDVLEIPQLMETCVRNNYYSEAMDLASHVRLLSVRYPLPIIHSIQQQVQVSSDRMLVQLISHLRKPVRLAAAIQMVGFLRRMDVFESELELRMVFLRCRHDYLQQRLLRIKRDISESARQRSVDAFEYTKKFIDIMREQMFEIGTQYVSVFPQEQGTLLPDYMVHVTQLIKSTLMTYLPMIEDTSSLASLLNQLQYCGMSLGRIGLDFRNILVHLFEEAMLPMLIRWINQATEELMAIVSEAVREGSLPSTWMASKTTSTTQAKRNAFQPPMLLVGYPSLAVFTNSILSTLNALRLLPAISLCQPMESHLDACFLDIGVALKQYGDYIDKHMPDELVFFQSYSAAYARCCIPYLKSCLVDGIYGHLNVSSSHEDAVEHVLQAYLPVMVKESTPSEQNSEGVSKEDQQKTESVNSSMVENEKVDDEANKEHMDQNGEKSENEPARDDAEATERVEISKDEATDDQVDKDIVKEAKADEAKADEMKLEESQQSKIQEDQVKEDSQLIEETNDNSEESNDISTPVTVSKDETKITEEETTEAKTEVAEEKEEGKTEEEEKTEEKTEETPKPKEETTEDKPEEKNEEKTEEKFDEKASEKTGEKEEEKTEEKANEDTEEKTEEKIDAKTEEKEEEKTEEKTEEKAEQKTEKSSKPAESKPKTNQSKKKHKNKKGKR